MQFYFSLIFDSRLSIETTLNPGHNYMQLYVKGMMWDGFGAKITQNLQNYLIFLLVNLKRVDGALKSEISGSSIDLLLMQIFGLNQFILEIPWWDIEIKRSRITIFTKIKSNL